ncbi:MAG TPA: D-alanine--D-alanine ligase family protein [Saprospiraceae bacterium]|nr:D-alanine--D-alanine ligase family protein [Saprospiraceae bacterium]
MMNIAIIAGGPSAERGISLKSAQTIASHLQADKYKSGTIDITPEGWVEMTSGNRVDLNDFSLTDPVGEKIISFDFAFIIIHGTPAEDGKLQGYFEMKNIPHSACGVLTSALTFNKQMCKDYLKQSNIPMAESMIVKSIVSREQVEQNKIKPPFFVKPNNNGSSYGVTKVKEWSGLEEAISMALRYDHEVMIERALIGPEYSCGVVREGIKYHVFPITEIIPKGEFFDYAAKYEGDSQEITPARLTEDLAQQCKERSERLYRTLGCRGMVRFDYILEDGTFFLLEANTTPGMSEASIIPQQAKAYGWTIGQLLDTVIQDCLSNRQ